MSVRKIRIKLDHHFWTFKSPPTHEPMDNWKRVTINMCSNLNYELKCRFALSSNNTVFSKIHLFNRTKLPYKFRHNMLIYIVIKW